MAADAHAFLIANTHLYHGANGRLGIGHDLLGKGVVGRLGIANDRHSHLIEDRVAFQCEEARGGTGEGTEPVRGIGHLPGNRALPIGPRVGPQNGRQRLGVIQIVIRRQVQHAVEHHAVIALVSNQLLFHLT